MAELWQLQADENAAKASIGDNPEITRNNMYQDHRIEITEQ